jgi:Arc/MetJ-type ribon-helix-helix transcriptional regulator
MRVTVSLPLEDVEFLDAYALDHGLGSRSEVVHRAIRGLRSTGLGAAYEEAWHDWSTRGDEADWEITIGDG